ncbi:succinyl-diaminopimelate desuccinylase [Caminibacter mediatlanticus TB-2]|uniref:Succinyl-diaminopimelate desuccinylase n=1 Tax=Caminibacter mediatlanticus TB-2 TaxID=391592 RepID=A0ABX5VBR1_9BACT|nr:succinyl-diaminopimelate desuccinylase [Caminibacter mediatlanticus]QCT94560.1 succinyl-diaminopimelate desuccinylase [Caminibacter mediatlanticus TB-2]
MDVISLFKKLLSFKSITPNDDGAMEFIKNYLSDFDVIETQKEGVKNLFIYKKFSEGDHLCFGGHIDVVPPGVGWNTDPFTPVEKDGFIYARGTQDMKSGLAAFLWAMKNAKNFKGTLSALITSDEEGEAIYGTKFMLEKLKEKNLIPDYTIVAEPTCEEKFGDAIKIGRRGSINGVLKKIGKQGHAAYPEKSINPIHKVAQVLHKIAGVDLDSGDEYFAPSKFVVTDIRAGMEVTNVTPGELKMMFNVRNNTHTNKEKIKEFIHKHFKDMNYTLELKQSAEPFITNPDSKVVKNLDSAIQKEIGLIPKHSTAGGTSDARFFAKYGVKVVEFGVKNDTIHAPNERVHKDEVIKLSHIFKEVIENWS